VSIPPVDPVNPQPTDAAAGSVFTGTERQARIPALSLLELLVGFGVVVMVTAVIALATSTL